MQFGRRLSAGARQRLSNATAARIRVCTGNPVPVVPVSGQSGAAAPPLPSITANHWFVLDPAAAETPDAGQPFRQQCTSALNTAGLIAGQQ